MPLSGLAVCVCGRMILPGLSACHVRCSACSRVTEPTESGVCAMCTAKQRAGKWSRVPPSSPGWWWCRTIDGRISISQDATVLARGCAWAGPVLPPD